jgi:hypothetical protein
MASARCEHDQVRFLFLYMLKACLHRIATPANHFRDTYRKFFVNGRSRTAGREHVPSFKSLAHRRELGPIIEMTASGMQDD